MSPTKAGLSFKDGFAQALSPTGATSPGGGMLSPGGTHSKRHHTMPPLSDKGKYFPASMFTSPKTTTNADAARAAAAAAAAADTKTAEAKGGAPAKSAVGTTGSTGTGAGAGTAAPAKAGVPTFQQMMAHLAVAPSAAATSGSAAPAGGAGAPHVAVRVHGYNPDDPPTPTARAGGLNPARRLTPRRGDDPNASKSPADSGAVSGSGSGASSNGTAAPPKPNLKIALNPSESAFDVKSHGQPTPTSKELAAITKIQAIARGKSVRNKYKDERLFQAWSELDWREEQDLVRIALLSVCCVCCSVGSYVLIYFHTPTDGESRQVR